LATQLNIEPCYRSTPEKVLVDVSELTGITDEEGLRMIDSVFKVELIYMGGKVMATGYGNSKKQAERNASINGLAYFHKHH
jgi:hypothetical protein